MDMYSCEKCLNFVTVSNMTYYMTSLIAVKTFHFVVSNLWCLFVDDKAIVLCLKKLLLKKKYNMNGSNIKISSVNFTPHGVHF